MPRHVSTQTPMYQHIENKPKEPSLWYTLGGVIATTFEYDDYGRQTAINDPSAGRRERAYDASGRIACETDARGKSVSCTYDDKGRIIRRVIDNGTIFEYTYDSHSNLIEMKTNGVVTRTYTYDEHSRLISMTESDYSKTWVYDTALSFKIKVET